MLIPAPGAVATKTVRAGLECAPYLIIGLRGSAQAMDDPLGMSGVTGTYAREALNKLPADRTKTYSLPYPAWGVTLKGFLPSVNEGRWILTIALRRLVRMCPGMNIGLIGYSQGAMVINQALPMLDAEERKAVRAVMMISDPQSAGDTSYDATVAPTGAPGSRMGGGILGRKTLPADIQARTTDFCIVGDPVCDAPEEKDLGWIISAGLFLYEIHTKDYPACCGELLIPGALGDAFAKRLVQSPSTPPVLKPMPSLPEGFCPSLASGVQRAATPTTALAGCGSRPVPDATEAHA
ncbi:MAG TPA: cutinase family protein [Nonomuraea sp.]|nr:cutinase family protein [Nonomuraea sp.]